MTYEELQKANKKLEQQANMCYARQKRNRKLYIKHNAPFTFRKYERITIRLRVTEETRKRLSDKEKKMKKWRLGNEYSVTGAFDCWYIHEDGHGELIPALFRAPEYSRFDEVLGIESCKEQPQGSCKLCRRHKEGLCYLAGGMEFGKSYATEKVEPNQYPCPLYEEKIELWSKDGKRHYPNVVYLPNEKAYYIYSLTWVTYTKYTPKEIEESFVFCNPNNKEADGIH